MLYVWYMAAVRQIGLSKETCLDHFAPWESSLPIYIPNIVKISWSGTEICPKTKFETGPLAAEFYFRFQFWQVSSFWDLPHSTRGWVMCDLTFSIPSFKPTLPKAQRHSAVMQTIYSLSSARCPVPPEWHVAGGYLEIRNIPIIWHDCWFLASTITRCNKASFPHAVRRALRCER